ncbi:hypothetical protein ZWY2020_046800 [Hordeum vulgare]|nr:hypothetical protein ZWY2020_046800 [Hordeum vulgare]
MEVGGEEFAVGVVISAKTTLGEESQEGVGRAERGEGRNVRVLKANYIQEFSVAGKYGDPLDPAGCVLDLAAIHAREEAALSMATIPTILIQEIDEAAGKDRIRMDVYST